MTIQRERIQKGSHDTNTCPLDIQPNSLPDSCSLASLWLQDLDTE